MAKQRVIGASRLRRKLKRMPDEVQFELRSVIREQGESIRQEIAQRAPVSTDLEAPRDFEGKIREHLRDAIEAVYQKDGLGVRVGIVTRRRRKIFFFARFLEFGTRFMEKRPFLFPAWRAKREGARAAVKAATVKALQTVSKSNPPDV